MTHPFPLLEPIWSPSREVLVTPEITSALEAGAAVAIGVSGADRLGASIVGRGKFPFLLSTTIVVGNPNKETKSVFL